MQSFLFMLVNAVSQLLRHKFLYFVVSVILLIIIADDYNKAVNRQDAARLPGTKNQPPEADRIVHLAMSFRHVPYEYAGKTPEGFDCSGFTFYVYQQVGIDIPGSSRTQYGYGESVRPDEVQKGDLVFFTSPSDNSAIGHVGIVISEQGNDPSYFIHSSSGKADGVTIDSLTHPYYATRLVGARRVIQN